MSFTAHLPGRSGVLAPAALLLLAFCLLAGGAQALPDSPALVISEPGLYTLDHDITANAPVGVLVNGSDVVLDGMGHRIAGTGADGSIGVLVSGRTNLDGAMGKNVTIRNLTVSGWDVGVRIGETTGTVVERVVAEKNGDGLVITASTGVIGDHHVRNSVFRENTGDGVLRGNGIYLSYPTEGVTIERCSVTSNRVGITTDEISHGAPNLLADSEISGNAGNGLTSRDGGFAVIRNCTFSGNGGDGMEFEHGGAEVVGCHIERNAATGIFATERGGSDIHGNWITGNGQGVAVGGDWPSLVRNNYFNNTDNGFFGAVEGGQLNYEKTAGKNIVGGPYLGGNFWANPGGTGFSQTHPDADGDGICDVPFVVNPDEGIADNLPLAPWNGPPGTVPTPYKPHPVPGRIEAEDYDLGGEGVAYHDTTPGNTGGAYRHDSVDIEKGGSGYDVGWIRNGEYLMYTLSVPKAGFYTLMARAATPNDERSATVSVNANPMYSVRFPNTGSFSRYTTAVGDDVYLPAGTVTLRLTFHGDGENLDWFALAPMEPSREPFHIPATIQAEDYDAGGYVDTTPGNTGGAYRQDDVDIEVGASGYNVGWIRTGESLTYEIYVAEEGIYTLTARVASPNSGRTIAVSVFGETLGTIAVPKTGSFSTYRTVSIPVTLASGFHPVKLTFAGDGQNLDWIAFAAGGTTPEPSGGASFSAAPLSAPKGAAVKFTVTPAAGKSVKSAWWSFDADNHLNTWNSRAINPTFFYPAKGTFSPLVKVTYADGSTETVQRTGYVTAT